VRHRHRHQLPVPAKIRHGKLRRDRDVDNFFGRHSANGGYLFIRHDGMQPGGYMFRERRNKSYLPPLLNKSKKRMWCCRSQCSKVKKQLPPSTVPFPSTVALSRPRGRVPLSYIRHGLPDFHQRSWGVGRRCPAHCGSFTPSFPKPANRSPPEESELDVDMSNWLNFRKFGFVPASGGVWAALWYTCLYVYV